MNQIAEKLRNEGFYATDELEAAAVADEIDRLTDRVTALENFITLAHAEYLTGDEDTADAMADILEQAML